MFKNFTSTKGVTLVELLVAISVFVLVVVVVSSAFVNINATQRKIRLSQELYEDTRFLMERIVKEVRDGTIDYEEYWSKNVLGASEYGQNYGEYAKRLVDPGTNAFDGSVDTHGTRCIDSGQLPHPDNVEPPCPQGFRIDSSSIDRTVGINPFDTPSQPEFSNAVCDGTTGADCTSKDLHIQDELYLINGDGNRKTIIRAIDKALVAGSFEVGILQLNGSDQTTRSGEVGTDGIIDTWNNAVEFTDINTNGLNADDFVSFTTPDIEITNLQFIVAPLENPKKAFNEEGSNIQHHPFVTIVITAKTISEATIGLRGVVPEITLQSTVSSRFYSDIKSF